MKATIYVDGGARSNPGPAGIAAVIKDENGQDLTDACRYIGEATNNVAEYRALLLGIELAKQLGVKELEIINDSELVARQVSGDYKVKNADLRKLFLEVMAELEDFPSWSIRNVPREQNSEADALVSQAIDAALV